MEKRAQHFRKVADSGNFVALHRVRLRGASAQTASRRKSSSGARISSPHKGAPPDNFSVSTLRFCVDDWLADGEIQLHSPKTPQQRRDLFRRLFSFLEETQAPRCSGPELRQFFSTLRNERTGKPLSIATNETFRRVFNIFWRAMVKQGVVAVNAMDAVPPIPRAKKAIQQVKPFEREQVKGLLLAARRSAQPRRDLALLYLLVDTGLRASEVRSIRLRDIAFPDRTVRVVGKGQKERTIYFHAITYRAFKTRCSKCSVMPIPK